MQYLIWKGTKYTFYKKKVVFMEANNIFKKFFKSLKIDKNNSQNLSKQKKKCKITLLYEFEVRIKHLSFSMRKCFLKTVKKTTKPRINYNVFFTRKTEGSGFNQDRNGQ